MRWDGQKDGADRQQALPGLPGLVRSVRTPDFADVVFHEVNAKSVLNKVPGDGLPFNWTVNPYRGCTHGCTYCLTGDTPVLLADGRTKPIADLAVGEEVFGTSEGRYVVTRVRAHWETVKPAYRVTLSDGTQVVAGGDHRFLTDEGWKHVTPGRCDDFEERPYLVKGARLVGTGRFAAPPAQGEPYRAGYLWGAVRGGLPSHPDVLARVREYAGGRVPRENELVQWPTTPDEEWSKGFLAGLFDARGSSTGGELVLSSSDSAVFEAAVLALTRLRVSHVVEVRGVRIVGGLAERLRFLHLVCPVIPRGTAVEGMAVPVTSRLAVVSVESLGVTRTLYDITTGTGDFVANGLVSHNCFARNTHTYLDLDAGRDFDTQVVVKVNAVDVLKSQLRSKRWRREHVAMGTNTDPYQRAEGRYRLMPGIIRALADSGTPFSILTKGTVLSRDVPLLAQAASQVPVGIGVSLALLDRELQSGLEPGTPSPQARLELVRRVRDAGLPCGVFVAPVLPKLTDSEEGLDALLASIADAGATGVTVLPLHLRPGAREWFARWLVRERPDLVDDYRGLYARGSYVDARYRRWLTERITPLLRRHGLDARGKRDAVGVPGDDEGLWPEGSLPSSAPPAPVVQEQLTLL
ncbi:intein-containing Rv2578c family radical SAM protein [Saccharothrix sp. S26]|uniref:intein-containing Rv2578c family radical SAM protein n=1 Tax=Saccharothrix sp. S26 TaxID=2907215 RepID=UPI001F480E7F|nr:intein-containing Rv2578c family radical SAM protein [Saccharothrix sp. S26]MCE6996664.1 intein-containing Rv2578c family radical SAM protein [Saccharothrix sp. S26]